MFLITGGRLGDLYGRRRLFLIGMIGFVATNTLCGLADTPIQLVIGRILQGISAAMLVPQVLGSIRALFPSEAELAKALSLYGVMMGLAAAIGQFAGGALVEWSPFGWGWRTVFLAKLPIGLVVMVGRLADGAGDQRQPPPAAGHRRRGAGLAGAACLVLPLSEGRQQGWPAWTFVMLAAVPVLAAAFLWFERQVTARGGSPLLDLGLMAIPASAVACWSARCSSSPPPSTCCSPSTSRRATAPTRLFTGLAILPYGIGLFVGPLVTGPLVRLRPWLLTIGMAIQVVGYAGVAVVIVAGFDGWPVCADRAVCGLRSGHRLSAAVQHRAGRRGAAPGGVAAGVLTSALQIGGGDQRGGDRQPVLRGAGHGLAATPMPMRLASPRRRPLPRCSSRCCCRSRAGGAT